MDIKDLTVIITGAASGIGAGTARYLSSLGAKLALCDINQQSLEKIAVETKGIAINLDITNEKDAAAAIAGIKNTLGDIGACINCAGIMLGSRIVGKEGPMELSDFKKVIDVNLTGSFNIMRLVADAMIKQKPVNDSLEQGVIINTASIAAFEGQIGQAAYSASKAGIVGLTLPAAREFAKFGIRVAAIAPGLIKTPMLEGLPEKAYTNLVNSTVFPKRLGSPEEFAKLAAHIIENPLINGEVIRLDGGVRLQ